MYGVPVAPVRACTLDKDTRGGLQLREKILIIVFAIKVTHIRHNSNCYHLNINILSETLMKRLLSSYYVYAHGILRYNNVIQYFSEQLLFYLFVIYTYVIIKYGST